MEPTLVTFTAYENEKHQCGYCPKKNYTYCKTCFPDEMLVKYACCSTATGRPCFAKHVKGVPATRGAHIGIAKKGIAKQRPERQANGARVRCSPRAQQARTGPRAEGDAAGARRRLDPEAQ